MLEKFNAFAGSGLQLSVKSEKHAFDAFVAQILSAWESEEKEAKREA